MSFGSIWDKLLFVGMVIIFVYLFSLMRRQDPKKAHAETVRMLLSDTRINLALLKAFGEESLPRQFETNAWRLNKKKVGFLAKPIQADIEDIFRRAVNYNRRLKAAKKSKSDEKIIPDVENMKPPLLRTKDGLEDWLLVNVGTVDAPLQFSGLIDGLFGRH